MISISENYKAEIIQPYLPALIAIGVNFQRDDAIEAIELCNEGLEDACQAFIMWWEKREKYLQHPTAGFIKALYDGWKLPPNVWQDEILTLPELMPRYQKWLDKAIEFWGNDFVNSGIMDIGIDMNGFEFIRLVNDEVFSLDFVYRIGFPAFREKISKCLLEIEQKYQEELQRQQLIANFKQRFHSF